MDTRIVTGVGSLLRGAVRLRSVDGGIGIDPAEIEWAHPLGDPLKSIGDHGQRSYTLPIRYMTLQIDSRSRTVSYDAP